MLPETEKVLVVGCGKQAEKHIKGLRRAGIENILLFDIRPELSRALGEKTALRTVDDMHTALSDDTVVAVDICAPTPAHFPCLKTAFEAGKHALCEKPLCGTVEQARELVWLARQNNCKCGVGFIYRFAPAFEFLKQILDGPHHGSEGALGELISASFTLGGKGSHAVWKHRAELGGGAINEMLVHMLDLAIWLFGDRGDAELLVDQLLMAERRIGGELVQANAEDYVVVRANFGGVESLIEADFVTPAFNQQVSVQGTNGTFNGSIQSTNPNSLFLLEGRDSLSKGITPIDTSDNDLFSKQMKDFARMINDPEHKARCDLSESLRVMEVTESLKSERKGDYLFLADDEKLSQSGVA